MMVVLPVCLHVVQKDLADLLMVVIRTFMLKNMMLMQVNVLHKLVDFCYNTSVVLGLDMRHIRALGWKSNVAAPGKQSVLYWNVTVLLQVLLRLYHVHRYPLDVALTPALSLHYHERVEPL